MLAVRANGTDGIAELTMASVFSIYDTPSDGLGNTDQRTLTEITVVPYLAIGSNFETNGAG